MSFISTKSWLIKRLALLLFLIYGCQVAQFSRTETYLKGKEWATFLPIEHVGKTISTLNCAANCRKKSPSILQRTTVHTYSFTRPMSFLITKSGLLARKYRPLNC